MDWEPDQKADLVHSMEVFYYLEKPDLLIQHIYNTWIKSGGRLIMGIDFYKENIPSHSWLEDCRISIMKLFSEKDWVKFFQNAGFIDIKSWRHGEKEDWVGTLIIIGKK
jgi:hypothetical protein